MKTIKEGLDEAYNKAWQNAYFENGFNAGVAFAQRWISVVENLPTEQGHYFVKCKKSFPKNCEVIVAEFYEDNQTFYSESSDSPIHDVTYWRPIIFK